MAGDSKQNTQDSNVDCWKRQMMGCWCGFLGKDNSPPRASALMAKVFELLGPLSCHGSHPEHPLHFVSSSRTLPVSPLFCVSLSGPLLSTMA